MSALVVLQREVRASARLWLLAAVAFFAGFQLLQLALLIMRFQAFPNYLEHVPPQLNQGDSRGAKDGRVYRH